jgi:hypothetical protein
MTQITTVEANHIEIPIRIHPKVNPCSLGLPGNLTLCNLLTLLPSPLKSLIWILPRLLSGWLHLSSSASP